MAASRSTALREDDAAASPRFQRLRNPAAAPLATYADLPTLEGCSAGYAASMGDDSEAAADRLHAVNGARRDRRRVQRLPAAEPGDAVPFDMCPRCGLRGGPHATAAVCIERLRDRLAMAER